MLCTFFRVSCSNVRAYFYTPFWSFISFINATPNHKGFSTQVSPTLVLFEIGTMVFLGLALSPQLRRYSGFCSYESELSLGSKLEQSVYYLFPSLRDPPALCDFTNVFSFVSYICLECFPFSINRANLFVCYSIIIKSIYHSWAHFLMQRQWGT